MRFTWSNILYLLPALALVFAIWSVRRKSFFGHSLLAYLQNRIGPPPLQIYLPRVLEVTGLLCLGAALLNPVTPLVDHAVKSQGLNMVLVVDLSSSMQMPVTGGRQSPTGKVETRLEAVKQALIDFIRQRKGDRIGVVVFSNNAYVVTPMTTDYAYLINYVQMINDRTLMDEGMTAIGEGLLMARDLLLRESADGPRRGNVIVLLTDGENNTGRPVDLALKEVKDAGLKTYFIGVEVVTGTTVENQGFNDAPVLIQGVKATGGKYFDARDAAQLNLAYREINSLEKGRFLTREQLRDVPAFAPFALAGLVALGAGFLLRTVPRFRELS
ncbi:MAG TPA: VWA domain-containing protein [Bryobacteraceae bacterium]|nr:VWA domain-containing protein [Bryobacteraceae bacterium]